MDTKILQYIEAKQKWEKELIFLRSVLIELPLDETIKWGAPTYMFKGKNVVGLAAFKEYFGLWFYQGGLLEDKAKLLQNAQEGKTKALGQWRFYSLHEVDTELVKYYVLESIENFKEGKFIKPNRDKPIHIPIELQKLLKTNQKLTKAFNLLKKGKQREYVDYISQAKKETTKQKRLEKIIPMILSGVGLHDKYKNC